MSEESVLNHEVVKEYYGEVLEGSADLKTNACTCGAEDLPASLKEALSGIHNEIMERFYGCGSPLPPALEGCTILDLGCGTGRDAFVAAKLAGPTGKVIGVDMTEAQLEVAERHRASQLADFGLPEDMVEFKLGRIEDLAALGIEDESIDVVMSNCVMNLAEDKATVFREIMRVLKTGGELYFSDVFADRRIEEELMRDPVLHGECLSGAMYTGDFRRLMSELGCPDARVVSSSVLEIGDDEIEKRIGHVNFTSDTVRAFKLAYMEDACEDYGQIATYLGGFSDFPHAFSLDPEHVFETDRPLRVCGNSMAMLQETRYAKYFEFHGSRKKHFGLFPCHDRPSSSPDSPSTGCC